MGLTRMVGRAGCAHIIDLLAEQVGFGADGAHIVFNRGYPVVLYEKPFCDMFKENMAWIPMKSAEDDPRVIEMRSDIVSTFFKELRAKINEEEQRRADGRHIEISVMVLEASENVLQYGVDIARLVKEKLLDVVYVYQFDFGATKGALTTAISSGRLARIKAFRFFPRLIPLTTSKGNCPRQSNFTTRAVRA